MPPEDFVFMRQHYGIQLEAVNTFTDMYKSNAVIDGDRIVIMARGLVQYHLFDDRVDLTVEIHYTRRTNV